MLTTVVLGVGDDGNVDDDEVVAISDGDGRR